MTRVAQTITLNGVLPIKIYTDVDTSKVDVDGVGFIKDPYFLDRDGSGRWSYDDQNAFFTQYNNHLKTLGKPQLSKNEFTKQVFTKLHKEIDAAAAASINNCANYPSTAMCHAHRTRHVKNGVPGAIDPVTGVTVNPDGTIPAAPTKAATPPAAATK